MEALSCFVSCKVGTKWETLIYSHIFTVFVLTLWDYLTQRARVTQYCLHSSSSHAWYLLYDSELVPQGEAGFAKSLALMSRIDLVSKNLLANCFRNFWQKRFKENCYQKSIEQIANVAKIAKVRRIFLAICKD